VQQVQGRQDPGANQRLWGAVLGCCGCGEERKKENEGDDAWDQHQYVWRIKGKGVARFVKWKIESLLEEGTQFGEKFI